MDETTPTDLELIILKYAKSMLYEMQDAQSDGYSYDSERMANFYQTILALTQIGIFARLVMNKEINKELQQIKRDANDLLREMKKVA